MHCEKLQRKPARTSKQKEKAHDEELASVGVLASIGHRQCAGALVLEREVLVGETLAINRLSASAVARGEVTTLNPEGSQKGSSDEGCLQRKLDK